MRLLPRTPRGTWTLAALFWAAGSAALWLLVPVRPRAEWAVRGQQEWVGYLPDRRAFVSHTSEVGNRFGGPLRFWGADTGRVVEWFDPGQEILRVVVSPNGKWIAVYRGRPVDSFQLFETATGRVRFDLQYGAGVYGAGPCFSPDGRWLACSDRTEEDTVHIWDVEAGQVRRTLRAADGLPTFAASGRLAFGPDGRTLALADDVRDVTQEPAEPARVQLWDWDASRVTQTLVGPASTTFWNGLRLHFSPDGRHLTADFHIEEPAGDAYRPEVRCWDVADGRETLRITAQLATVTPGRLWVYNRNGISEQQWVEAWAYSGRRELNVTADGGVTDGKSLVFESPVQHPVRDWLIARGVRWPLAIDESVQLEIFDAATRQFIARLSPRDPAGSQLEYATTFSPDGRLFAEATLTGVRIWDIPPRKPLAWCATGSALLALLLAGLARLRLRKLRQLSEIQHP